MSELRVPALVALLYTCACATNIEPNVAAAADGSSARVIRVQPALSEEELALPNPELIERGYPPRPDKEQEPRSYALWLESVSQPMRVLDTHAKPLEYSFGPATSVGWCGVVATSGPYDYAWGGWNVPSVTRGSAGNHAVDEYVAAWVGVGGWGNDTLIQAGTLAMLHADENGESAEYAAFVQVWPFIHGQQLVNFPVAAGDRVYASAQIRERNGNGGGIGMLYLFNTTQGNETIKEYDFPYGYTGASAEWVAEGFEVNTELKPVANFGSFTIGDTQTWVAGGHWHDYQAASYDLISLVRNDKTLCHANEAGSDSIEITWLASE